MVLGIQIGGFLFGIFMIYYSFLNYKKKSFGIKELLFWIVIWVGFMVITLFSNILDPITKSVNLARTFDLLIIAGFILIIGVVFYMYSITKKNLRQIEDIVRVLAMRGRKGK